MIKKKKNDINSLDAENRFFNADNVVSGTECTGLIPTPPISEEAADSYTELYPIPQPEEKINNGFQHK